MASSGSPIPQYQVNYPQYPTPSTNKYSGFSQGFTHGMNMGAAIAASNAQYRAQRMYEEIFSSCMQGKGWSLQEQ